MSKERFRSVFKEDQKVLNVYCTAGYPELASTLEVMRSLQTAGVHIIELGVPYSDPLADGPVIQHSSSVALKNGMTIEVLFKQLKFMREEIFVPVVLMGYLNPLLQYGFENFCSKASEVGVDGLIIPDIPIYEYEQDYQPILEKYGLAFTFLVTPETSEERIRKIDNLSSGFVYAVSSSSITGSNKNFSAIEGYLERLQKMQLNNPVLVGFGIKDKQSFNTACRFANGAIIGSAYIKALENATDIRETTKEFIDSIIK